ncbi:MAG: hypothetical protein A3A51_02770 [Candidatus Levybacteria bacterium RIFCSPLOWO2_01_FULL_39_10]|nr:MAG: hypothetical protein A3A51_02770 [Candidatus Levybacteria bacterium RIFCSPLOWO2_01_FULL_39_10]
MPNDVERIGREEGTRIAKRRERIIRNILDNPDQKATPYWINFMRRNRDRIIRFGRTAMNKGQNIRPEFR